MRLSSLIPADAPDVVRAPELAGWLHVSRRTIWQWVKSGILPKPLSLGPKTLLFNVAEVRAFLDRRDNKAARQQGVKGA